MTTRTLGSRPARTISPRLLAAGCLFAAIAIAIAAPGVAQAKSAPALRVPAQGTAIFSSDVYVVSGAGDLVNPDPRSTPKKQELFNIAGEDLGLTFGQWLHATATSLAEVIQPPAGVQTDILLSLKGLIPNEVYSLFYDTFTPDSANPVCPAVERLVALPAWRPSASQPDADSFVAGATGKAKFHARVAGNLLAAQRLNIVAIAHFNGQTYGPVPNLGESINCSANGYGGTASRQLLIIQTGL